MNGKLIFLWIDYALPVWLLDKFFFIITRRYVVLALKKLHNQTDANTKKAVLLYAIPNGGIIT